MLAYFDIGISTVFDGIYTKNIRFNSRFKVYDIIPQGLIVNADLYDSEGNKYIKQTIVQAGEYIQIRAYKKGLVTLVIEFLN